MDGHLKVRLLLAIQLLQPIQNSNYKELLKDQKPMATINSQLLMPSLEDLNSLILILEKVDGGEPTLELLRLLLK
jgi:hypothetical protein